MTASSSAPDRCMPLVAALEVVRQLRQDKIVVTSMGTAREWPKLSDDPLDFHYVPSAMGHAPMLGLGLALAQPAREVIVFSGDGSLLMSLGCLVTIVSSEVRNLTVIVMENGVYEVTGGQKTAASAAREGRAAPDLAGIAWAAGIASVQWFDDLGTWQRDAAHVFGLPGPRLIVLRVAPVTAGYELAPPCPMADQIARFRAALR